METALVEAARWWVLVAVAFDVVEGFGPLDLPFAADLASSLVVVDHARHHSASD